MLYPRNIRSALVAAYLSVILPPMLFAQDTTPSQQQEAAKLVAVLTSDASVFDKARACHQLASCGDKSAVPVLATLLADEKLACYARGALEAIPGPAAGAALREAVAQLDGNLLIGVLGSIGVRRDAAAVDAIVPLLDGDGAAAAAAARTLGQIGTPRTADILQERLARAAAELRPALGNACLICVQSLLKRDREDRAVALCDAVRNAGLPEHIALAAAYNEILAEGKAGLPLLAGLLDSDDETRFRLAMNVARQLGYRADVSKELAARFKRESPERQVLLLIALGDLGEKASLPTVVEAARSGKPNVRVRAILTLAKLGDATVVPVLLEAATQSDDRIAGAARSTLAVLNTDEINAAIVDLLDSGDARTRQMAVDMAAQRRIALATPILFKLANGTHAATRLAAIRALGSTARIDSLPKFIDLAIGTLGSDSFPVAESAFKAACVRMPREAAAQKLVAAMSGASTAARVFLLEQLAAIGGPTALETVVAAARSDDDAMQDAATRLLGQWSTPDAAPAMLDLAKTLTSNRYKIRTLRGYVRIAMQLNMTPAERLAACRNTLAIARRTDERLLVFEVLRRHPTPKGLALAVSLLGDEQLRERACSTIVSMAGSVASEAPQETEKALARVLDLGTDQALGQEAREQLAKARDLAQQRREETEFTQLFNGTNLDGWECSPGVFRVEDGAIVGGDPKKAIGRGNDFACTKKEYGDFELRLQFKLLGASVNGGVNLRSKRNPRNGEAAGYQADLGQDYWGCLFDEARRRRMLAYARPKPTVRAGDWNDYRIRCEGNRIRLWVGGVKTVDYTEQDPNVPLKGIIALQVQANRPGEAWYRNIRIKEL